MSSELRIGNLVSYKIDGTPVAVMEVLTNMIVVPWGNDKKGLMSHLNNFNPIPITEEWLVRMGFENIQEYYFENIQMKYWALDAVCLFYNESPPLNTYLSGYGFTMNGQYYCSTFKWIEYVHQLQNLYFALTGEELEIKQESNA